MTGEIFRQSTLHRGDTIGLGIPSGNERWIIDGALSSSLKADSFTVFSPADSLLPYLFNVLSATMRIRYTNLFREGMFGTRKVRREVFAEMTSQITRLRSKEVLYSGTVRDELADTVAVDDIPFLESGGVAVTQAALPPEHGFDRFIEPFVIIGATAVAVYLLFHVRS